MVYEASGESTRAVDQYRRAWELSGRHYDQALDLGRAYRQLGQCGDAIAVLQVGLETKPTHRRLLLDSSYYMELGQCYASMEDVESARRWYHSARELLDQAQAQAPTEALWMQQQWIERALHDLGPEE
jgi:Flp pilus assembly protein TadD